MASVGSYGDLILGRVSNTGTENTESSYGSSYPEYNTTNNSNPWFNASNGIGGGDRGYYTGPTGPFTGQSNPFTESWSMRALGGYGIDALKGAALPAGVAALTGGNIASAAFGGAFSPGTILGGIANVGARSIGLTPNSKVTAALTGVGTLLGGPLGGILGSVVGPVAGDMYNDYRNLRSYEYERDLLEDNVNGYAAGRTIGGAFAEQMGNLSGNLNLGVNTKTAAAAYDAVKLGSLGYTNSVSNPLDTMQTAARYSLDQQGFGGWENNALMSGFREESDFQRASEEAAAVTSRMGNNYRSAQVQQAANVLGLSDLSRVDTSREILGNNREARSAAQASLDGARAGLDALGGNNSDVRDAIDRMSNDRLGGSSNDRNDRGSNGGGSAVGSGRGDSGSGAGDSGNSSGSTTSGASDRGNSSGSSSKDSGSTKDSKDSKSF